MRKPPTIFRASGVVLSVHDGDTFKVRLDLLHDRELADAARVDLGFRVYLQAPPRARRGALAIARASGAVLHHEVKVRLRNVLAPELNASGGPEAAQVLAEMLPVGARVKVVSRRLDKYGRVEGDVVGLDGLDINAAMREAIARIASEPTPAST